MSAPNPGRNRHGVCGHCQGRIYRYPTPDGGMGAWAHLDVADWRDDPHDPQPVEP